MRKIEEQVGEYLDYCDKVRGMSKTTMSMKRYTLRRFLNLVKIERMEEFNNSVFGEWVKFLSSLEISFQSMNAYNSIVLAMVRYFQDMSVLVPLNMNLVRKLKGAATKRKFYTASEIRKVISRTDYETGLMILIMFETGMRIAELVRLKTSEISGRRIDFIGKGSKSREVYMTIGTARSLHDYLDGREGYVWGLEMLNGEPPTANTVRQRMMLAFSEAGYDGFYPHALRHSFATALQRKGATVEEIKEMMGHSSIATTERYLHGFEGRMEELFNKYQR